MRQRGRSMGNTSSSPRKSALKSKYAEHPPSSVFFQDHTCTVLLCSNDHHRIVFNECFGDSPHSFNFLSPSQPKTARQDVRLFLSTRPICCFFVSLLCSHYDDSLVFYECFGDSPRRFLLVFRPLASFPRSISPPFLWVFRRRAFDFCIAATPRRVLTSQDNQETLLNGEVSPTQTTTDVQVFTPSQGKVWGGGGR